MNYKLYCLTCKKWVYTTSDVEPIECPVNINHIINENLIEKIENSLMVSLQEDPGFTNRHLQCLSVSLNIPSNTTDNIIFNEPLPITIINFKFYTSFDQEDDIINAYIDITQPLGTLTRDHITGESIIDINTSTNDFIHPGYHIIINNQDIGRILSVSGKIGDIRLIIENTLDSDISLGQPFYIRPYFIKNYILGPANVYKIGSALSNTTIQKNKPIVFEYTNNGDSQKNIKIHMECFY